MTWLATSASPYVDELLDGGLGIGSQAIHGRGPELNVVHRAGAVAPHSRHVGSQQFLFQLNLTVCSIVYRCTYTLSPHPQLWSHSSPDHKLMSPPRHRVA